jgi:hypothetical protein
LYLQELLRCSTHSPTEASFSIKTDRINGNITINKGEHDVGVCMAVARRQWQRQRQRQRQRRWRQREAWWPRTTQWWQRGGGSVTLVAAWRRCRVSGSVSGSGGSAKRGGGAQRDGGSAVAAARRLRQWPQRDSAASAVAWWQRSGGGSSAKHGGGSQCDGSSVVAAV